MRIISDFHDYYDCLQRYGQDQSLIYNRKRRIVITDGRDWPSERLTPWQGTVSFRIEVVGFCGQIYKSLNAIVYPYKGKIDKRCRSLEEVEELLQANLRPRDLLNLDWASKYWGVGNRIRKYFEQEVSVKYFDEAPIWLIQEGGTKITYNPCLKDIKFYQVVEMQQAYQRLAQYLGSQAQPEKPIPHIDDKTMAQAKGFDKWSFRKEPS